MRVALDAARAAAAVYVVLHHVAVARGWVAGAGIVLRFGQEAVLLFFLLSGFVIFANERDRAVRPWGYYLRRLRRIYPPLIFAMLVSTLIALDNGDLARRFSTGEMIATLLSVQDIAALKPGVIADPFLGNQPLWSLSYEVAFYLAFPAVLAVWRRRPQAANVAVPVAGVIAYALFAWRPNHVALVIAYFPIWWAGAMAAEAYQAGRCGIGAVRAPMVGLIAMTGVAAVVTAIVGWHGVGYYPALPLRHFAVALLMLAGAFSGPGARALRWSIDLAMRGGLARAATAVASISYGLYVLHMPLLIDWQRATTPVGLAAAVVVLLVAAIVADRGLARILPRAPPG